MPHLKLVKLLYLAETEHIKEYNQPLLGDNLFSMKNGPILSTALDFIQGEMHPDFTKNWDKWVSPKENHKVSLARKFKPKDLDLLSVAVIKILKKLWKHHRDKDEWEMVNYTHANCKEWKKPSPLDSSERISYKKLLLKGFGYTEEKATPIIEELESQRKLIQNLYALQLKI